MQARGGHISVEGRVFDQRDIGDSSATQQRTFEQIVAEHAPLGQAPGQHRVHGLNVQQSLATERAFVEYVLVHLRARGAVGVDATLSCEQPVKARQVLGRGQGGHHARLQDAVPTDDALTARIEPRLVVGMRRDANQVAQAARRQLRVAVQSDDVAGVRGDARHRLEVEEGRGIAGGQCRDQPLQLASFALPAHPGLLGFAEAPLTVQHDEPGGCVKSLNREAFIQIDQATHHGLQQGIVRRQAGLVGIDPIGQQGELSVGLRIRQVVQVEPVDQDVGRSLVHQHGRDDDHHPVLDWDALTQGKPGKPDGPDRLADQAVHGGHHRL